MVVDPQPKTSSTKNVFASYELKSRIIFAVVLPADLAILSEVAGKTDKADVVMEEGRVRRGSVMHVLSFEFW
jgi:hypothetical protein